MIIDIYITCTCITLTLTVTNSINYNAFHTVAKKCFECQSSEHLLLFDDSFTFDSQTLHSKVSNGESIKDTFPGFSWL